MLLAHRTLPSGEPGLPSRRRLLAAGAALLATAGCAVPLVPGGSGLDGRIWDVRAARFITRDEAVRRALGARLLLLGETHDNAWHHRIQAELLEALLAAGRRPALVMEQFDTEHQAAMDAARREGVDAEALARAGQFDARGWEWAYYKPLVEAAVKNGLPLLAANLSRTAARELVRTGGAGVAVPAALRGGLERDIRDGHCGMDLPGAMMAGMVAAQSARDARMAQVLAAAAGASTGAVLVAGRAHVRRDRGVPAYLDEPARAGLLSIGLMEAGPDDSDPRAFLDNGAGDEAASVPPWDLLWFARRMARPDPCAALRKPAARAG